MKINSGWSFLITRIITGIVGMGLAVYVIDFGSWLFSLTVLALAMLAWHEFARAFGNAEQKLSYLLGMAAIMFMIGCAWQEIVMKHWRSLRLPRYW